MQLCNEIYDVSSRRIESMSDKMRVKAQDYLAIANCNSPASIYPLFKPTRLMNSLRIFGVVSKLPRTQLVIVVLPVFLTPRIIMHRWEDSITTATP